ncbi:MAG: InlB B-repeat-containing protein, partial [Acutalibacteraceae bacterium]
QTNRYTVKYVDEKFKVALNGSEFTYEAGNTVVVMGTASGITFTDTNGDMYKLTGWLNDVDNVLYQVGESFTMPESDVTLTAQWEKVEKPVVKKYTVAYEDTMFNSKPNGIVGEYEAGTHINIAELIGEATVVDENGDTYKFIGWKSNTDGKIYMPGEDYTVPEANTVFTAQWELVEIPEQYRVIYLKAIGDSVVDNNLYFEGDKVTVKAPTVMEYNDKVFTYWTARINGEEVIFYPGDVFTMPAQNVIMMGHTEARYHIYYDFNGGTGDPLVDNNVYDSGDKATILDGSYAVKEGYIFNGWCTNPEKHGHCGNCLKPGDTYTFKSGSITLYARWATSLNVTFTVKYDANGGTGETVDSNEYLSGAVVEIMNNNFVRPGYRFVGWNTSADGSGKEYCPTDEINISENMLLYAIWEKTDFVQTGDMTDLSANYLILIMSLLTIVLLGKSKKKKISK